MKKISIVAVSALLLTAIQFAAPATSVPNSNIARRVTALETKVKSLRQGIASAQANARAAKDAAAAATGKLDCMSAVGISERGDPTNQLGYVWAEGGAVYVTTGLDLTAEGQTPALYVARVDGSCVTAASPLYRPSSLERHRAQVPFAK